MNEKSRLEVLDVFKGLAILLVVIGHTNTGAYIHNFIYGFHLFAFLFASGILYKSRSSFQEFFHRDVVKPLLMFLFFAILYQLFHYGYTYMVSGPQQLPGIWEYSKNSLLALAIGNPNFTESTFGAAWYLMMNVSLRMIYYFLDRMLGNKNILLTLVCAACTLAGIVLLNGVTKAPYYLASALSGLLFFQGGRLVSGYGQKLNEIPLAGILSATLVAGSIYAVSVSFSGSVNMGSNTYDSVWTVIPNGVLGIVSLIGVSCLIARWRIFPKLFSYFGKNSLSIMGWHSPVKLLLQYGLLLAGIENLLIKIVVILAGTLLLCVPLNTVTGKLLAVVNLKKNNEKYYIYKERMKND